MRVTIIAAVVGLAGTAWAQEGQPLSGPSVKETQVPGVRQDFGGESMEKRAGMYTIPQDVFERAIRALASEETPGADRLTAEQTEKLRSLRLEHEAALKAFMGEHEGELREIRRAMAAKRTDGAGEGDMDELRRRAEEIRRQGPSPAGMQKQAWLVLTESQRSLVEARFEAIRVEQEEREAKRYAERMMQELEQKEGERGAPGPQGRDLADGAMHPLAAEFREKLMKLPPEEQVRVIQSLRRMFMEAGIRPGGARGGGDQPAPARRKPAPSVDDVKVPKPDEKG